MLQFHLKKRVKMMMYTIAYWAIMYKGQEHIEELCCFHLLYHHTIRYAVLLTYKTYLQIRLNNVSIIYN